MTSMQLYSKIIFLQQFFLAKRVGGGGGMDVAVDFYKIEKHTTGQ